MKILVLNAGLSSHKSSLYDVSEPLPSDAPAPLWEARIDWNLEGGASKLRVSTFPGPTATAEHPVSSREDALTHLLETLWQGPTRVIDGPAAIEMVGIASSTAVRSSPGPPSLPLK